MEGLSQNELIGVVTLIRDKKEYQQTIFDCGLLNELHQIVHHEHMNEKYKQKISKLIKEIEGIKKENDNLRKDNLVKLKELF